MATGERELTTPTQLCRGRAKLNPDAKGYSALPVMEANLRGGWGRNKRWDYWGILAGDLLISTTYADVDYLGIVDAWWHDLTTGESGGGGAMVPFAKGIALPDTPGTTPLRYRSKKVQADFVDDQQGTHLRVTWTEGDGRPGRLEALIALPEGHESVNVVIPWSKRRFQYTSKQQARAALGTLTIGDEVRSFGGASGEAWGVLDVGRGRWPYRTNWNWGGGAGRSRDGSLVGIQVGGRWTEGTGATENGIIVDGKLNKIGCELEWSYDWDRPLGDWRLVAPDGSLDLVLHPRFDKHSRTEALVLGMEVHQVFGHWSGTLRTDEGRVLELDHVQGFAEEARNRW